MKKIISVVSILAVLAVACAKKTVPAASPAPAPPPAAEPAAPPRPAAPAAPAMEAPAPPSAEMMTAGKATFSAKCGRCHDLPDPARYSEQRWGPIMVEMSGKAKLTKEETVNVTAYVKANARK
jgi:cytochrome c5